MTVLVVLILLITSIITDAQYRIVGGSEAQRDEYQFVVRLFMNRGNSCGASIINPYWLLTAAHCLVISPNPVEITTWPSNVIEAVRWPHEDLYQAEEYWIHEDFRFITGVDRLSAVNDIALIRLTSPISNADIISLNQNENIPTDNDQLNAVGFGFTNPDLSVLSPANALQKTSLQIYPHSDCESLLQSMKSFPIIVEQMICAWNTTSSPCFGDSGGPLFDGIQNVLMGVASFGAGECYSLYPTVFVRVSNYIDWIESHMAPYGDSISKSSSSASEIETCFSAYTTVELENGLVVPMKELNLGDRVLTSNGKYEPIYSFGHYDKSVVNADYLQIYTSTSSGLEISPNHLVYMEGNRLVLASDIAVGDKLMMASGKVEDVVTIRKVRRTGAFAPFTPSGTIVTNGIQSSCFAAIQGTSSYLFLNGLEIPVTYHQLGLVLESPHRLSCQLFSDAMCLRYELYNEKGVSRWVEFPMKGFKWLLQQNSMVSFPIFIIVFISLCFINLLELVIMSHFSLVVPLVLMLVIMPSICKTTCITTKVFVFELRKYH